LILLKTITQIDQINDPTLRRVISQRFNEPFDPDIDGYGIVIEPGEMVPRNKAVQHNSAIVKQI
jgi:hypothetical protein